MRFLALTVFLAACVGSTPAVSQECKSNPGARASITEVLTSRFGEHKQNWLWLEDQVILELWANPQTGTWTMLRTHARGFSCIAGTGTGWRPPPGVKA